MTRTRGILLSLALLLLGLSCYVQISGGSAGDKDWLLYAAGMGLKGRKLYVDVIEPNPPLILWLYSLPAFLALKTGIADYYILVALGLCTTALTIALAWKLVRKHPAFAENKELQVEFALMLAFVLIFRTDPSYFFDRDHIFLVLTLPYVLRWLPPLAGMSYSPRLRAAIGVMAAIGFSIKPHCLLVLAAIQILYLLRERSLAILISMENVIIYAVMAIYLLCVLGFAPTYVNTVFPMALQTYGVFARRAAGLLYAIISLFTLAVSCSEFRPRDDSPYLRDIYYLFGVCFFFLLYGVTNNGWGYSYNPLTSYVLITVFWLFLGFSYLRKQAIAQALSPKRFTFGQRGSAIAMGLHGAYGVLIVLGCFVGLAQYRCEDSPRCMLSRAIMQELKTPKAVRSFSTMSIVVGNWSEMSKITGAPWQTRFNCLWMMYKFILLGPDFASSHKWILDYTAKALADDLSQLKPQVVFVDTAVQNPRTHVHVDFPTYFSAWPLFKSAWQEYRFGHSIDFCDKPKKPEQKNAGVAQGCMFDIYYRTSD